MNDTIITWIVLITAIPLVFYCFLYALDKEKKAKSLKEKVKDLEAELDLAKRRIRGIQFGCERTEEVNLSLLQSNRSKEL
jgi:hypothetical protein